MADGVQHRLSSRLTAQKTRIRSILLGDSLIEGTPSRQARTVVQQMKDCRPADFAVLQLFKDIVQWVFEAEPPVLDETEDCRCGRQRLGQRGKVIDRLEVSRFFLRNQRRVPKGPMVRHTATDPDEQHRAREHPFLDRGLHGAGDRIGSAHEWATGEAAGAERLLGSTRGRTR